MRSKTSNGDELELREDEVSNLLELLDIWGALNLEKSWKKMWMNSSSGRRQRRKMVINSSFLGRKKMIHSRGPLVPVRDTNRD